MSRGVRRRVLPFAAVALAAVGFGLLGLAVDAFRRVEHNTVDARFSIRGDQPAPSDVVVVQIDDVTFSELNRQWPFPRSYHARVIDRVRGAGARAIAYDVQFTEPTAPREDNALIAAAERAGGVVFATTEVDEAGRSNVFGGDEVLREIDAVAGNALLPSDSDGVIRRLPASVQGLDSFAVAAARNGSAERLARPPKEPSFIDFRGPPGTVRAVPFARVLRGRAPRGLFRDRIVVVGPSAPSLQDVHATSTSGDELMAGAEIQANAIATALDGFPLREAPDGVDILLVVLLGLAAPLAALRLAPVRSLLVSLAVAGLFLIAVQVSFNAGRVVAVTYPLAALALGVVGTLVVQYGLAALERERVRSVFSRFVPEPVVDEVLARTDGELRLGGVRRDATVLFCDLRGFTEFAERLEAERVIDVLNRYLGEMSGAILDRGGTLVAYMGDGIMAVFGAPLEQPDHADRAVAAARDMLEERLPRFNRWLAEAGLDQEFRMGVGINSGPVMSGNVGSERRMEYAAVGDTTNTAARLEAMTKGTSHQVLVADSTRARLKGDPEGLAFVEEMQIRGREAAVKVWGLRAQPEPVAESAGGRRA